MNAPHSSCWAAKESHACTMPPQLASVSLHPVASRNGNQSSTVVPVQLDVDRSAGEGADRASRGVTDDPDAIHTSSADQANSDAHASPSTAGRPTLHRSPHSSGPGGVITPRGPQASARLKSMDAYTPSPFASHKEVDEDGDMHMSTHSDEAIDDAYGRPHAASTSGDASLDATMPGRFAARAMPEAPVWGLQHPDLSTYPVVEPVQPPSREATAPAAPGWSTGGIDGTEGNVNRKRTSSAASAPPAGIEAFWSGSAADAPEARQESSPPLRKITASQFSDMFDRYAVCDTPHAVVFPFLHGVDGDNFEQNIFFGAPLSGMPTPRYRGLTIVRANMPTPQQRSLLPRKNSAASQRGSVSSSRFHRSSANASGNTRSRTDSVATDNSETGALSSEGHGRANASRPAGGTAPISTVSSSHSVSSHGTSIFSHRSGAGNASVGSMTSFGSNLHGDDGFFPDVSKGVNRLEGSHAAQNRPYEPQPPHSLLNSTVFPESFSPCLRLPVPACPSATRSRASAIPRHAEPLS